MDISGISNKIVIPLGVLLTFVSSLISIYYTRKNLKTSKYIDTIIPERIKKIEQIRKDLANLNTCLNNYVRNNRLLVDLEVSKNEIIKEGDLDNYYNDDPHPYYLKEMHKINDKMIEINDDLKHVSKNDVIEKATLFKLRLNPQKDIQIITILNNIIDFINQSIYKEDLYKQAIKDINQLVELTHEMLNSDWEKIKKETNKK